MKINIWPILILFFLFSCDSVKDRGRGKGKVIARVKDQVLYEKDLANALPKEVAGEDSVIIRQGFITSWVKEQLLFLKAKEKLSRAQKDKEHELQEYYRSLLKYEYEVIMLAENADSIVTDEELKTYYLENQKNFELKRNIIRLLYVKVPWDAPDPGRLRLWMQRHDGKDLENLNIYVEDNAVNYSLDTSIWFHFDDITKEVPLIAQHDPEHFIRHNKYVELRDENFLYLINIIDNRIRDELSPLALEKNKIKQIILNKRKVMLLQEMENRIYREGRQRNLFEIYNN